MMINVKLFGLPSAAGLMGNWNIKYVDTCVVSRVYYRGFEKCCVVQKTIFKAHLVTR